MMLPLALLAIAFGPMLFEAGLDARNSRGLRTLGAREPPDDVYPIMRVAYPACFLGMVAEAWLRGAEPTVLFGAGLVIFLLAKGLKYWAIATLGPRWTFRVLVPPGSSRTIAGPYRFMTHPNYVGVMGELAGMAIMCSAWIVGAVSIAGFGILLLARIRVEERALGMRAE